MAIDCNGSDWIKLNVGGHLFVTTKETITKRAQESSRLVKFIQDESKKDSCGVLWIDRSPDYFKAILNYLRTGVVIVDPSISVRGVLEEAKYYEIHAMIPELNEIILNACQSKQNADELISNFTTSHKHQQQQQASTLAQNEILRAQFLHQLMLTNPAGFANFGQGGYWTPPAENHVNGGNDVGPRPMIGEKEALGEQLYALIQEIHPDSAGKITGMLLEQDPEEIKSQLRDRRRLKDKIDEATSLLNDFTLSKH